MGEATSPQAHQHRTHGGLRGVASWTALLAPPLVVLFFLAYLTWSGNAPGQAKPLVAPDFSLVDQHGERVSLSDFGGRAVVVAFGYTLCADSCPLTLARIQQGIESLPSGVDRPGILMVTVDPDRDTPERLLTFSKGWDLDWHFLTGTFREVSEVWEAYGISGEKSGEGAEYEIVHTNSLAITDPKGNVIRELRGDWVGSDVTEAVIWASSGVSPPAYLPLVDWVLTVVRRCGELAATAPHLLVGLVMLSLVPGFILAWALLRVFLRDPSAHLRRPT